jgi:hypothetical protein
VVPTASGSPGGSVVVLDVGGAMSMTVVSAAAVVSGADVVSADPIVVVEAGGEASSASELHDAAMSKAQARDSKRRLFTALIYTTAELRS